MGSQPTSVCVCGWEEPHKARHVCVSEVRRGICESVAGVAWRVRGERAHGTTAWVVGVVATALTLTHTSVGGTTVGGCAWCHHSHTQRTGRGSAHSGGGWWERRTVVVAATPHTQPPPPRAHHPVVCVCESGVDSTSTASEWTKWPHTPQHPRCHHHIHHQQQEEEWCGVGHKEWVDV